MNFGFNAITNAPMKLPCVMRFGFSRSPGAMLFPQRSMPLVSRHLKLSHAGSMGSGLVAMKRMLGFEGYSPLSLKSTFRDWAEETTSFAYKTLLLALTHTNQKAGDTYRRQEQLEKFTKLMQQWQAYVEKKPLPAKVVHLEVRGNA